MDFQELKDKEPRHLIKLEDGSEIILNPATHHEEVQLAPIPEERRKGSTQTSELSDPSDPKNNKNKNIIIKENGKEEEQAENDEIDDDDDDDIQIEPDKDVRYKSAGNVYLLTTIINMGSFFLGYHLAVFTLAWERMSYVYDVDPDSAGLRAIISSVLPLGAIFGCLSTSFWLTNVGERRSCMILDLIGIGAQLFLNFENYWVHVFVRLVLGFVYGANEGIIPQYVRQVSPIALSGVTGSFFQLQSSVGNTVAYALGLAFPVTVAKMRDHSGFYWRFVLQFPIIANLIRVLFLKFYYKHTTPQNYLLVGKYKRAKDVIGDIYKEEYVNEEYEILLHEVGIQKQYPNTWTQVFSKFNRPRLVLGCMVMIELQLTGFTGVSFYSNTIFLAATGGDKILANILTFLTGVALILTAFIAGLIATSYGRRPITLIGYAIIILLLVIIGSINVATLEDTRNEELSPAISGIIIALIFLYFIIYNLTGGTISWYYNADILFGKSLGVTTAVFQLFSFVIGVVYPVVDVAIGGYVMFYLFAITMFMGWVYLWRKQYETRGLSRHQIEQLFVGNMLTLVGSTYVAVNNRALMLRSKVSSKLRSTITTKRLSLALDRLSKRYSSRPEQPSLMYRMSSRQEQPNLSKRQSSKQQKLSVIQEN